jgi:hypothetical protein
LKSGCEYLFVSQKKYTPGANTYVSMTFNNTGVSSDKHGLSFPEPVDFSKLAGGANAANYALQFDYDRGSQSLAIMRSFSG